MTALAKKRASCYPRFEPDKFFADFTFETQAWCYNSITDLIPYGQVPGVHNELFFGRQWAASLTPKPSHSAFCSAASAMGSQAFASCREQAMLKIINAPHEMQKTCRARTGSLGFVPTMGALHQGHAELVKRARAENNQVVVSLFVNPTQFNDPSDLEKYPRTWDEDIDLLSKLDVDYVFSPDFESLYPDQYSYVISEKNLSPRFCGANRPGHFDGVLTVVMKLLQITGADRAYFGEKDYQQLKLIEGLVQAFFLPVEIIPVGICREASGLAMSSRNKRLSPEEASQASEFYQILDQSSSADEAARELTRQGFKVDYVEDFKNRRLGAIQIGSVRLIDNVEI